MSNNLTTRPKKQLIIGIDPDTQGSGWACINITDRTIHLEQLTIPKIVRLLQEWRNEVDGKKVTRKTLVKELSIMEASDMASYGRIQDVTDARVLDIVDIIKAA